MKQNQEVAKKENTALAMADAPKPPAQEVLSGDIVVPKILLMQGLSKLVAEDRKAQSGDIVRSTTEKKIGDDKSAPIAFIPLKLMNTWREEEKMGQKFAFRRSIPRTPGNENQPWSFFRNPQGQEFDKPGSLGATEWRRVKEISCFVLLPGDIDAFEAEMKKAEETGEMPDLNSTILPNMISFRSTSFNAGKTVATYFAQIQEMLQYNKNVKSFGYTLPLTCVADKNDKGNFFVWKVGTPTKLEAKYLAHAERWYNTLMSLKDIKVDESKDAEVATEGSTY
jgi:hypothetical protein